MPSTQKFTNTKENTEIRTQKEKFSKTASLLTL